MRHGPTNVPEDGTEPRASPRPNGFHAVTHPLPPGLVSSHTHRYQHRHHTKRIFSWCLYPCLSQICNTHAYLSSPCQMHQLHIHTCYITYAIDLKRPLFTFISHTTFLLNKVWPKNYFRVSTYIQHYKVIWRSMNANLHCMVPTMIFIPHCEFVYFHTIYKVSHNKEKRRASLSPSHTPCTPLSRMHTKLSPGPLKVSPQKIHACFIFLT